MNDHCTPIITVNLGPFTPFRGNPKPRVGQVAGLRFARGYLQLRAGEDGAAVPRPRHGAFVSVWEDETALDAYEASRPLPFAGGYSLRLLPVHQIMTHPQWGELVPEGIDRYVDGPLVVIGFAHDRLSQTLRMFRATKPATAALQASASALVVSGFTRASSGMTFTMWRDLPGMRQAVTGSHGHDHGHRDVMRYHGKFFKYGTFVRSVPLRVTGLWDGTDPLAGRATPRQREPA